MNTSVWDRWNSHKFPVGRQLSGNVKRTWKPGLNSPMSRYLPKVDKKPFHMNVAHKCLLWFSWPKATTCLPTSGQWSVAQQWKRQTPHIQQQGWVPIHTAGWKKSDLTGSVMYDSIYRTFWKRPEKQIQSCQALGEEEEFGYKGHRKWAGVWSGLHIMTASAHMTAFLKTLRSPHPGTEFHYIIFN